MIDIGEQDGASPGDLVPYQLGRHALPVSHELHLLGYDALPSIVQLGDAAAGPGSEPPVAARPRLHVAAAEDPVAPQRRKSLLEIGRKVRIRIGSGGVVERRSRSPVVREISRIGTRMDGSEPGR